MTVEILYPSLANLYGETMHARYLEKCLPDARFVYTEVNDVPAFAGENVDLICLGPMSENAQQLLAGRLAPYKDRIEELIRRGTVFLVTGNALELFGQYIENEDGSRIDCLGIFETWAKRQMMRRYNSLFLGSFGETRIVGFKAQFSHSWGAAEKEGLFRCVKGDGLCPGAEWEGLRRGNFFGTYLLGPLLILNPDFTKYLLSLLGAPADTLPFEKELYAAYEKRLAEFENPAVKLS